MKIKQEISTKLRETKKWPKKNFGKAASTTQRTTTRLEVNITLIKENTKLELSMRNQAQNTIPVTVETRIPTV